MAQPEVMASLEKAARNKPIDTRNVVYLKIIRTYNKVNERMRNLLGGLSLKIESVSRFSEI